MAIIPRPRTTRHRKRSVPALIAALFGAAFIVGLAAPVHAAPAAGTDEDYPYSIRGNVRAAGEPLEGVTITVTNGDFEGEDVTDEKGAWEVGMPTKVLYEVPPPPSPARTDYAKVDDVEAVPFLSENGRRAYQEYLTKMTPRAFAVSPSGAWTWAEEGEDPDGRALATCTAKSTEPCRLYSVDDYVVWTGDLDQAAEAAVTASRMPEPKADAANSVPTTSIGSNKATN